MIKHVKRLAPKGQEYSRTEMRVHTENLSVWCEKSLRVDCWSVDVAVNSSLRKVCMIMSRSERHSFVLSRALVVTLSVHLSVCTSVCHSFDFNKADGLTDRRTIRLPYRDAMTPLKTPLLRNSLNSSGYKFIADLILLNRDFYARLPAISGENLR